MHESSTCGEATERLTIHSVRLHMNRSQAGVGPGKRLTLTYLFNIHRSVSSGCVARSGKVAGTTMI